MYALASREFSTASAVPNSARDVPGFKFEVLRIANDSLEFG